MLFGEWCEWPWEEGWGTQQLPHVGQGQVCPISSGRWQRFPGDGRASEHKAARPAGWTEHRVTRPVEQAGSTGWEDQLASRVDRVQDNGQNGRDGGEIGRWRKLKRKPSSYLIKAWSWKHQAGNSFDWNGPLPNDWCYSNSNGTGSAKIAIIKLCHLILCFTTSLSNGNSVPYYYCNSRTTCTVLSKRIL